MASQESPERALRAAAERGARARGRSGWVPGR